MECHSCASKQILHKASEEKYAFIPDNYHTPEECCVQGVALDIEAVPTSEDDSWRGELKKLQKEKEEIDVMAHRQVRRILWSLLGMAVILVGLFFWLTFWEFSWDVMEPIAFFSSTTVMVIDYAYFLFTSRDFTYQDFMRRLSNSRQRKLFKKRNFDVEKFKELQQNFQTPFGASASHSTRPHTSHGLTPHSYPLCVSQPRSSSEPKTEIEDTNKFGSSTQAALPWLWIEINGSSTMSRDCILQSILNDEEPNEEDRSCITVVED